jgi:quinol monooxygenase YgiN
MPFHYNRQVSLGRREFIVTTGAATLSSIAGLVGPASRGASSMYGLIGKMMAVAGQRDALIAILLEGTSGTSAMPGCLSYVIAEDPADENAIWITEVWDSEASHAASLALPSVKQAIAQGRPKIAGFGERVVTRPVGGHGLTAR